eukprot:jgi/Chrpa1/6322/Chrysochromulina_OHIO_Genome00014229-RA
MEVLLFASFGCSDFYMPLDGTTLRLSVRTMDLGLDGGWNLSTAPANAVRTQVEMPSQGTALQWTSRYGSVVFTAPEHGYPMDDAVGEALNARGLSCGALTLTSSKMPDASATLPNLHMRYVCQWAVDMFASVAEVRAALSSDINLYGHNTLLGEDYTHWVFRDATGQSLVVEAAGIGSPTGLHTQGLRSTQGLHLHDDPNDGVAGFGIITNEPVFEWHLANARHLQWKRTLERTAIGIPGGYYPEERFMRVLMTKQAMSPPRSLQEGVAQAVAVLNTITVPMGNQYGTDSGKSSAEIGSADHTVWGVIRDHVDPTVYFRSAENPTLQRVRLADLNLDAGAAVRTLSVSSGPWYHDASNQLLR